MRYKSFIVLLALSLSFCTPKEKSPSDEAILISLLGIYYNVPDECVYEYGTVSPLGAFYKVNLFDSYPKTCKNAIIGNSTQDIGRQIADYYDPSITNNYGIGGNTACDMLIQMEMIECHPENVIIATADGNGVLRNVPSQISIKTVNKIIVRAKQKWNANVVLVGIHPVQNESANKRKNAVNEGVRSLPDCFIDMVGLFGVGINDPPPASYMADPIHYKEPIYTNLKNKILTQCGVSL